MTTVNFREDGEFGEGATMTTLESVSNERLAEFTTPSSQSRGPTMQECVDMARELQQRRASSLHAQPDGDGDHDSDAAAIEIADAVIAWMVKYDLLDADQEYRDDDIIEVLNDLRPVPQPQGTGSREAVADPTIHKVLADAIAWRKLPGEEHHHATLAILERALSQLQAAERERNEWRDRAHRSHEKHIDADERLMTAEASLAAAREALKQIAGVIPWQDSEMGFNDLARAALSGSNGE